MKDIGTNPHIRTKEILYSKQGKMTEAKTNYLRVLTRKEMAWGPEHILTLDKFILQTRQDGIS